MKNLEFKDGSKLTNKEMALLIIFIGSLFIFLAAFGWIIADYTYNTAMAYDSLSKSIINMTNMIGC